MCHLPGTCLSRSCSMAHYAACPVNRIEAVTLHHNQDAQGRYIPMQFTVNSWVTLMPDLSTAWGRDSARYPTMSSHFYWKARIIGFKYGGPMNIVSRVIVRHAYELRQLELDPAIPQPRISCNYLFPSFDDSVELESITGLVVGVHADIGKVIHHDRTPRELRDASIYFYKWVYVPPSGTRLYGSLEEIPLPGLSSHDWLLPDMSTSEAFRAKMRSSFQLSMKPSTGSRRIHLQWFMPFTVFVDLFASARNRVRTPTLFTFRSLTDEVFSGLMDDGWGTRTTDFEDLIRCTVACPSVVLRYHIGRQTLYVNFYYTRERLVDRVWVPMEQEHGVQLVDLKCEVLGQIPPLMLTFTVGSCWPIEHLRGEVQISMGQAAPTDFHFVVADSVNAPRKINRRCERTMTVTDVFLPRLLKLKIND